MPSLDRPCRVWQGAKTRAGYGLVTRQRKNHYVHRLAWAEANGPIPPGMCVLHHCDNPPCHEPTHLFLGTKADNVADMDRKGRRVARSIARKLTAIQVSEIRRRQGERYATIAADYGVTPQYVGQLMNNVWRKSCAHAG